MNEIKFDHTKFIARNQGLPSTDTYEYPTEVVDSPPKKKTQRKKKDEIASTTPQNVMVAPQSSMAYLQENIPYTLAYQDTNAQLDSVINDLNLLGSEIIDELHSIRQSKTLKGKYTYINDMTATASSIINTKLSAIKEKSSIIHNIQTLELNRMKQLKTTASAEDDNTRIANLYDAFINTPIATGYNNNILGPSAQDAMLVGGGAYNLPRMETGPASSQENWEASLSPAENRMVLEAKGSIDTVVMYDETTGNRWFEVLDKVTRQPVNNVERPDASYIYDLDINVRAGYAKDSNRGVTYPLVIVNNGDTSINQY